MGETQFLCRPESSHEQLLDTLFLDDERAARQWRDWRRRSDIDYLEPGVFELLPLLYRRLRTLVPDDPWIGRLRGVYKRTWTNNVVLFRSAVRAVSLLRARGIESIMIKGMGLLPYYDNDPGRRTMADADLLVRPEQASASIDCLAAHGWRPNPACSRHYLDTHILPRQHSWNFLNGELQLDLHWHPVHRRFGDYGGESLWRDAVEERVLGVPLRVPCPADAIVLSLIHGGVPQSNRAVQWVTDVMQVVAAGLDPEQAERLARRIDEGRFSVWAADRLGYLEARYGARVLPGGSVQRGHWMSRRLQAIEYRHEISRSGRPTLWPRAARLVMSMLRNGAGRPAGQMAAAFWQPAAAGIRFGCSRGRQALQWRLNRTRVLSRALRRVAPGLFLPPKPDWRVPVLPLDAPARLTRKGTGYQYTASGWALQETDHLWSDGYQARLVFTLDPAVDGHVGLALGLTPYIAPSRDAARVDFAVNRRWVERLDLTRPSPGRHALFVDASALEPDRLVDVVIGPLDPGRPAREGEGDDPRLLGVCLRSLTATVLPPWDMTGDVRVAAGQPGALYLGTGWWQAEAAGAWMAMHRARLRIPLRPGRGDAAPSRLIFVVSPLWNESTRNGLVIDVSGRYAGSRGADIERGGEQDIHVHLKGRHRDTACDYIDIVLRVDRLISPAELLGTEDRRQLGVMLHRIVPARDD